MRGPASSRGGFVQLFQDFSRDGASGPGLNRLSASLEDQRARERLSQEFRRLGAFEYIDEIGNQFGFVREPVTGEDYVLLGSHLDSQPHGGRFDGQYGVVAGLSIMMDLFDEFLDKDVPNLAVVNWTNEEGARFQPSILGSSVFTGAISLESALSTRDSDGTSLREALTRIGYLGVGRVHLPSLYCELHVEQGGVLESHERDIGAVPSLWGAAKIRLRIVGEQAHTGPTPMSRRRDAWYALSRVVTFVYERACANHGEALHGSVSNVRVEPESPNTLPHYIEADVEFRSDDPKIVSDAKAALVSQLALVEDQSGCLIERVRELERPVREFWAPGVAMVEKAASERGLKAMRVSTIAGHDAVALNAVVPTLLCFVPSRGGIAHNPLEFTSDEDMLQGIDVLKRILMSDVLGRGLRDVSNGT